MQSSVIPLTLRVVMQFICHDCVISNAKQLANLHYNAVIKYFIFLFPGWDNMGIELPIN